MENVILWVDDLRDPHEEQWKKYIQEIFKSDFPVVWVKSYDEFCNYINRCAPYPAYISFDHDLGLNENGTEKNGYDCAKYLVNNILEFKSKVIPHINVHSSNPAGKENIEGIFKSLEKFINNDKDI